jgi:ribosomal protein S18 acetylase RimI-like enzyme
MPAIVIRPALLEDLNSIVQIKQTYHTAAVWQMERRSSEEDFNVGFREVRLPRSIKVDVPNLPEFTTVSFTQPSGLLVATMPEGIVGYILVKEMGVPRSAWVDGLAVREEFRRKGIGSALLMAGEDWARNRHLMRVVLEMQSKNVPAIHMAMGLGFEFCGYHDQYFANRDIALFFGKFI